MPTLAETWREQGRAKGRAEGLERGLEQGAEAQRQTLLSFLVWRFRLDAVQETLYRERLGQVRELRSLTQLTDALLDSQTLAEFDQKLQARTAGIGDK